MRNKNLNEEITQLKSKMNRTLDDLEVSFFVIFKQLNNNISYLFCVFSLKCQTDTIEDERDSEIKRLNEQMNELRMSHSNEMANLRISLEEKNKSDLRELKSEYERQLAKIDESESEKSESELDDNFRRLKEQIKRSKELDQELLGKVSELNSENIVKQQKKKASASESIPIEIREILEKLDNEGLMLLTMSEIMRLKTHIANQNSQNQAQQSERNTLTLEIYKLRDLLADIKNLNQLCTSVEESDWRSGIIKTISEIFLNQKEHLLTELKSFVASSGGDCQSKDYAAFLEGKIDDLVSWEFFGRVFGFFGFLFFFVFFAFRNV